MTRKRLKICYDRVLDEDQKVDAALRAIEENPANVPILPEAPGGEEEVPLEMALETRTLWKPGRTLRVRFLDGVPSVQEKVKKYASEWGQYANINLVFGNDPDAEIRISFSADTGSWSYLGTDALTIPRDRPTMNFGWLKINTPDDEYSRVVLHEFGHALGCIHEHQHPQVAIPWNKPAVYRRYAGSPNFWTRQQVDRNLFQHYSEQQTQFSEFDTQSIMLYAVPKELTDGVFEVGWNRVLSDTDKAFIGVQYPFDTKTVTELGLGAPTFEAAIGEHGEEDLYRFTVPAAGRYTVETSGYTDVVMGLFGPGSQTHQLAQDDDSGLGRNARIIADLQPGEYFLRLRHYRPTGTGSYGITVKAGG
jgi:hypothetical protein